MDWFSDESDCIAYLEKIRWKNGFTCPSCGSIGNPYRTTRGRLTCPTCGHQTTVTAGTIFHRTRTPLRTWFSAAWYITNQKHGTNALGLQRILDFKSYQTAWAHLHKFRRAMVRPDRERFKGQVEVDETYVGGREESVNRTGVKWIPPFRKSGIRWWIISCSTKISNLFPKNPGISSFLSLNTPFSISSLYLETKLNQTSKTGSFIRYIPFFWFPEMDTRRSINPRRMRFSRYG